MKKIIFCLTLVVIAALCSLGGFAKEEEMYCDITALTFDEEGNPTHDENGEELIFGIRLWEGAYAYIRQDQSAVCYGVDIISEYYGDEVDEYYPIIKTLYISDDTSVIQSKSFTKMTSLEKVRISNGIKKIEEGAFFEQGSIELTVEGDKTSDFLIIEKPINGLVCDGLLDVYCNIIEYTVDGEGYYYRDGKAYSGFFEYEDASYYAFENGSINYEDQLRIDGVLYKFEEGKLVEGPIYDSLWVKKEVLLTGQRGWVEFMGKTYYVSLVTGEFNEKQTLRVGGVVRTFNEDFSVKNGLVEDGEYLRFYDKGVYLIGWVDVDGDGTRESYFLSSNGNKVTYGRTIGGRVYEWLDGALVLKQGLAEENGDHYYYRDGLKIYGFVEIEGKSYYFLSSTRKMIKSSSYKIGGFNREFNEDHSVKPISGWQVKNGKTYYYENGIPATGFRQIDGYTYYFQKGDDVYGEMASGWISIGGNVYYFFKYGTEKYGRMVTGRQTISSNVYFFNSDGTINTGFVGDKNGNVRYYYYGDVLKGWYKIGGDTYYFTKEFGNMVTGEKSIGGVIYKFTDKGVLLSPSHDAQEIGSAYQGNGFDIGSGDWSDIEFFG